MRDRLYTVHEKGRDVRVVSDGFDVFALILPPLWAIWHGAWVTLVAYVGLAAAAFAWWSPLAAPVVELGIALILAFEGGSVRRAELRLRRWRRVGLVEARSAAGAEELYLKGEALAP